MFHKQKSLHQNVANLETSVTKRFSSTTIPRKKNCHEDLVLLLLERKREGRKGKVTEQQQIIKAAEPSSPDRSVPAAAEREAELKGCSELPPLP